MPKNKAHKSKFSSKGAVAQKASGRVAAKISLPRGNCPRIQMRAGNPTGERDRRVQKANAVRKNKNAKVLNQTRLGSASFAPRIVGILPLSDDANAFSIWRGLEEICEVEVTEPKGVRTVVSKSNKHRFSMVVGTVDDEQEMIDIAKVSDIIVLVVNVDNGAPPNQTNAPAVVADEEEYDEDQNYDAMTQQTWFSDVGLAITDGSRHLIQCLTAQGVPTIIVALQGLSNLTPRKRHNSIRLHTRYFNSVLPQETVKVVAAESSTDFSVIQRMIRDMKLRSVLWRDSRPYMLVDSTAYDPENQQLSISGYVRGRGFDASHLVHLTNFDTYQMDSIVSTTDPYPLKATPGDGSVLDVADPETQESLQCTQLNDTADNEQDLEGEDYGAKKDKTKAIHKIRVPKGVSEYQAAWYDLGQGGELYNSDEDNDDDQPPIYDVQSTGSKMTAQTDIEILKAKEILRHDRLTDEERLLEVKRLREESKEDREYPDEIETPFHIPARQRFAKYRGMKSFATSEWNPKENLPHEYGRIFSLKGYKSIRNECFTSGGPDAPVQPGMYVTIILQGVPPALNEHLQAKSQLLIASVLYKHEQKWSVVHFNVTRNTEFDEPIKSKTTMLAHVGFRKLYCGPIFSDVPNCSGRSKFSRYFHVENKFQTASFYGPITFDPCPILLFGALSLEEQAEGNSMVLEAFGAALAPNPAHLILKRAVLTGRLASIHKKQVVVKYMFFNDEDAKWFAPIDLYSRLGRRGKILKSIGCHGLFKAQFNDILPQHDIVCMDLWKRVFPKWTTAMFSLLDSNDDELEEGAAEED